jgi:hypothetical protein
MTTSKNVNGQTSNRQRENDVTALEGSCRETRDIDDSSEEESYELLPSGD